MNVALVLLVSYALIVCGGCESDSNGSAEHPSQKHMDSVVELPQSDVVLDEQGHVFAVREANGAQITLEDGEAIVGDWIYIASDKGQVEKHRMPNVIQRAMNHTPYLYLDGETGEHVVTDGFQGNAYVNPATRRLCWPALTCRNPKCASHHRESGDPFLFSHPLVSGASVGADGQLVIAAGGGAMPKLISCPQCNSPNFVHRYEIPDEVHQRAALDLELARVRAARDRARNKSQASN